MENFKLKLAAKNVCGNSWAFFGGRKQLAWLHILLKHLFSLAGALAVTGLLLRFGPPSLVGQALWEFRTEARRWLRDYFERTR